MKTVLRTVESLNALAAPLRIVPLFVAYANHDMGL
jgi:hypothetical protein